MKNFDEKLRERIFDAEMDFSDGLWDKIESRIDENERKPNVWLLFLVAVMSLPLIFFYSGNQIKKEISPIENEATALIKQEASQDQWSTKQLAVLDQKETTTITNFKDSQLKEITASDNASGVTSFAQTRNNLSSTYIQINNDQNRNDIVEDFKVNKVLLKFGKVDQVTPLNYPRSNSNNQAFKAEEEKLDIGQLFAAKTQCPSFNTKFPGLYMHSSLSTGLPSQLLSAENPELSDYIFERDQNERGVFAFAAEVGFGFQFLNGLYIESGISYSQINTKYESIVPTTGKETHIIEKYVPNDNGGIDTTYEETFIPISGELVSTHANTFRQIDVPLIVGYQLDLNKRFKLNIESGILFNLQSWNEGHIKDTKGDVVAYGTDFNNQFYKSKLNLGYKAGIGISTEMNTACSFHAGLDMRYYPQLTNESVAFRESYLNFGLTAGIRYKI